MTQLINITIGDRRLVGRLETAQAPATCAAFLALLPLERTLLHARWSGEAGWAPLGDVALGLPPEAMTCHPAPGQLLLYPGGVSEPEILFPYGACMFASKAGMLPAAHFLTIVDGADQLREIGAGLMWRGAHPITFAKAS